MKYNILSIVLFLGIVSNINSIIWFNDDLMFNCSFFYHHEGDINIGVVLELRCNITHYRERYYRMMAFLLAVDEINKNPNLLPNVTLGFTVLNTHCPINYEQELRRQHLIQFLPDTGLKYDEEYCENGNHPVWFDVVGTIIPSFSGESVSYAYATRLKNIPLFTSAEATSDEFTNKDRFPYFFRTVSGDSKQVDFMLHFLRAMNWVYVSVVYTGGPYGENAIKQLNLKASEFGICIEVQHMVPWSTNLESINYYEIIDKLLRYKNARVIIGFFNFGGDAFERALTKTNATKDFIFLGSDTIYFKFDGVFRVQPVREMNETFFSKITDFFYQRDARILPEDPWIRKIYAKKYNCPWKLSEDNNCQAIEPNQPLMEFFIPQTFEVRKYIRMYDVAFLYAKGIDKTLRNECISVPVKDQKQLQSCVKENLVPNMKFIENDGTVRVKLDENGDAYARWRIYQNQNGIPILVATYDETENPKLQIFTEKLDWSVFGHFSTQVLSVEDQNITTPESVCSKPCKAKEYIIQQELACCWTCRKCLINEYIVNGTSCKACPF